MKNKLVLVAFYIIVSGFGLYGQNKKQQIEILQLKKDSLLNVHQILTQNNFEYNQKIQLRKNEYASKKELKKNLITQLNNEFIEKNEELSQLLLESKKYEDSIHELDFSKINEPTQIKLSSKKIDSIIKNKIPLFLQNFSYKPLKNNFYNSAYYIDYNNEVRKLDIRNKLLLYPVEKVNDSIIRFTDNHKNKEVYLDQAKTYLININKAFSNKELNGLPVEFQRQYLELYSNLFMADFFNNKITFIGFDGEKSISKQNLECFTDNALSKYNWLDEFQKKEFSNRLRDQIIDYLIDKSNYKYANDEFSIVYYIELGEYDFSKEELMLYSEKPISCNISLSNFNSALYLKDNKQIGRLDASRDFIREKQDYGSSLSGNVKFNTSIKQHIAKDIVSKCNSDRFIYAKFYLNPSKLLSCKPCYGCYELDFMVSKISFSKTDDFKDSVEIAF